MSEGGSGPEGALPSFLSGRAAVGETFMSIRAVMSRPLGAVATTLAGVAVGLVISAAPTAAQPDAESSRILRAYDTIDESKRRFSETMIGFVADLGGAYGNEGYRLRAALEAMDASLAAWDDAVGTLERVAGPIGAAGARLVLAQVYLDRHRIDDARRECQRAIELDPTRPDGYVMLGRIHLAQSQPELAADAFQKASVADPSDALNFYQLASAYGSLGRTTEATAALQAFVGAAERRLNDLWSAPGAQLSESVRSRVLRERSRFVTRQAPVDMLASADGGLTAFLPAAYESAARHFLAGDYEQAVAALRDAIRSDPLTQDVPDLGDNPEQQLETARRAAAAPSAGAAAYVSTGHVLMALKQPDEARQAFERALELDATLETPRLRLASLALSEMNGGEALDHLETAVKQHPASSEARRLLGNAYWAAKDIDAAVTQFNAALALEPADERLRTSLQAALLSAPRNEEVEAAVKAAVAAHARSGLVYQNLGRFHQSVGRNREAVAAYREALQRYPLVAALRLHLRIAEIHVQQLQLDEAIGSFRAALAVDPNNVVPRSGIARLLMEGNRLDEAYPEYLVVLLLDPLNSDAHARVAQIELLRGHFVKAIAAARLALAENPDHMPARYTLGQALIRSGGVEEGRSELAEYARRQSESEDRARRQRELDALNQEALALARTGRLDRAIELLRKAVDMDPSGMAHANLGLALMDAGRFEEAIESLEKAAELAEHSEVVRLYLADAYKELGRLEESERARATYERMREERLQRSRR